MTGRIVPLIIALRMRLNLRPRAASDDASWLTSSRWRSAVRGSGIGVAASWLLTGILMKLFTLAITDPQTSPGRSSQSFRKQHRGTSRAAHAACELHHVLQRDRDLCDARPVAVRREPASAEIRACARTRR